MNFLRIPPNLGAQRPLSPGCQRFVVNVLFLATHGTRNVPEEEVGLTHVVLSFRPSRKCLPKVFPELSLVTAVVRFVSSIPSVGLARTASLYCHDRVDETMGDA